MTHVSVEVLCQIRKERDIAIQQLENLVPVWTKNCDCEKTHCKAGGSGKLFELLN